MPVTPEDMEVAKRLSTATSLVNELMRRLKDALLEQAKASEEYHAIIRRDQGYND